MATTFLGRAIAVLASGILTFPIAAAAADVSQQQEAWETQFGQQRYMQLMQRGEIVPPQSPLYATLQPIGDKIAAVANAQYFTPFHFILVNEGSPNAFSAPGGNVYVTTSMLSFVRNQDELAGVLCHEVNHDIHHDLYNLYQAQQLQAPTQPYPGQMGRGPGGNAQTAGFTRTAESNADRAGAYTCAKAGFNPWGMVWNFRQFHDSAGTGHPVSDHPSDDQRVADLIALFNTDKSTFGRFADNVAAAVPIKLPANMQLAQQSQGYGYRSGYAPQGYGYSPQGQAYGYPPQGQGYGYPPGYAPQGYGYPPQAYGYPPQGQGYGYPPGYAPQGYGYPPQGPPPGYAPQGYGYPPGYAPQGYGYPPQGPPPGYPPQSQRYGYPPGYAPQGYGYPPLHRRAIRHKVTSSAVFSM